MYINVKRVISFFLCTVIVACTATQQRDSVILNTWYGTYVITEPVVLDLLAHPMFIRLKNIHQYGISCYMRHPAQAAVLSASSYNRYDHSIGVFVLLRRYGVPLLEQIAGLLHDVSHTTFSHTADFLFKSGDGITSYQDDYHEQFLHESGLAAVLAHYGISVQDIHHKNEDFRALEQELPNLCADRLEYNLAGAFFAGLLAKDQIEHILGHIKYENGDWFFTDQAQALRFAQFPLYMTQHIWGSPASLVVNTLAGKLMRRALENKIITLDDIHFKTDDFVWQRLYLDEKIQREIAEIDAALGEFSLTTNASPHDFFVRGKFRGIDPLVQKGTELHRLTTLDQEFNNSYEQGKTVVQNGWYIQLSNNNPHIRDLLS